MQPDQPRCPLSPKGDSPLRQLPVGGKGEIGPQQAQRMFAGDYIEHQELNQTDEPVRVIQIWFVADPVYRGLAPHYQQLRREELPAQHVGDATVYSLIGDASPMAQHMTGRLTASVLDANGMTTLTPPRPGEDLFVYVTDGAGSVEPIDHDAANALDQYDVILARPDMGTVAVKADAKSPLHYLSFYLPRFLK